eukprot:TRINITY_DN15322_c0_g1_i1.p1 TRINITY_DN15322_c0_g1~~TRINITY_DN15322_c0_g1_i1.p1  ORF type:complete len:559 (+),score=104.72 TRINITY_DN15322_c0_g1_i1:159-1835(+)
MASLTAILFGVLVAVAPTTVTGASAVPNHGTDSDGASSGHEPVTDKLFRSGGSDTGRRFSMPGWMSAVASPGGLWARVDASGMGMGASDKVVSSSAGRTTLLTKLDRALGRDFRQRVERRMASAEEILLPLFATLPRNRHGRIGFDSVRYVLQRLLRQRRSWVLGGLQVEEKADDTENAHAWLSKVLVPEVVQSNSTFLSDSQHTSEECWIVQAMFKQRMDANGADLGDVAILAAVVEELVHSDMRGKLKAAYLERGFPLDRKVKVDEADDLVDLAMMSFVRGRNISYWSSGLLKRMQETITMLYPPWPRTQKLMRKLRSAIAPKIEELSFEDIAAVVEAATDKFGEWNEMQCQGTRESLLSLEDDHESGRVRLLDFYRAAVYEGNYEFTENPEYLRQLGGLDESDREPRLIIPNYLQGPSNCVARTGHYSVCCYDECEELLTGLEHHLRRPSAFPAEIIAAAKHLNVPFTQEHRPWLRQRLDAIAKHHDGRVPVHGRLFAQWMHFAFPRQCQYAHPANAFPSQRQTMEQWELSTGLRTSATVKQLQETVKALEERGR